MKIAKSHGGNNILKYVNITLITLFREQSLKFPSLNILNSKTLKIRKLKKELNLLRIRVHKTREYKIKKVQKINNSLKIQIKKRKKNKKTNNKEPFRC